MFISFLGLGQGGGNIADEASKNGFYSAAINFSQKDLDSLEHIDLKLKLVGSEGIGKQRNEAIRLMNNNWDMATNFIVENFSHSSIEIIFVPFSTGGGSGGGMAPVLLSLLKETLPDKTFVAMPIIPDKSEPYTNQRNCIETFDNLSDIDICTIPIDNDKAKSKLINKGKNHLYKAVNENVVDLIQKITSYTERDSKYGVLDKKDLKNIFKTSGVATVSEIDIASLSSSNKLNEKDTAIKIRNSWDNGYFTDIHLDHIIISGFIFDGQEQLLDFINIEEIYSFFGNKMPLNLFEGYYIGQGGKVLTILGGLTWCVERLEEIENLIWEIETSVAGINTNRKFDSKVLDTVDIHSKLQQDKNPKITDISSIINKFKR